MLDLNNLKFKVTEICDNIITVNLTELSNDKDAEELLLHLRAVAYLDKDKYHKCHLKFSSEWDDDSIELVTVIGTRYKTESEMIIHKASVIERIKSIIDVYYPICNNRIRMYKHVLPAFDSIKHLYPEDYDNHLQGLLNRKKEADSLKKELTKLVVTNIEGSESVLIELLKELDA